MDARASTVESENKDSDESITYITYTYGAQTSFDINNEFRVNFEDIR